jgi:fructose-1,6-bisphosphatase/inositol monophosphatase family enzyme
MYSAERGHGAFCDSDRIHVSNRSLRQSYTTWGTHLDKEENLKIFEKLIRKTVIFKSVCTGWESAMIASGKLDAKITFDPHGSDYDYAPGSLLISEAGGIVANLGVKTYDFNNLNFIAANPIIYKELTSGPDALFPIN